MAKIGIDIGTSYSSVCILDRNNQPERVKVATGTGMFGDAYSLPSAVFVEAGERLLLGQAAMANRMRLPENFKSEFKRDLGQVAPYLLGDRTLLPEDLYKEFFIYLKGCAEEYTHESVTEAAITCPAVFNQNKKELIRSAAKKAGLLEVTLLDEPSAAAFCYLNAGKLKEGDTLLVYDLGGGTFDVALLRLSGGDFQQLTLPQGLAACGGADFDKLIFDHILEQIGEERLAPIRANPAFFRKFATLVMETAVKAKHFLSGSEVFSDVIPVGYDGVDMILTRKDYNALITPMVDETMYQVETILKHAGIAAREVTHVLLVGGASRTPLVRERLAALMGKEPLRDIDPELAVCAGAAVSGETGSNGDEGPAGCWEECIKVKECRYVVKKDGLYGIVDHRGTVLAPLEWEDCKRSLDMELLCIKDMGRYGFVDLDGELVLPNVWEDANGFSEGLAAVWKDGKWGYIDENGWVVIVTYYDTVLSFSEGLAAVCVKEEWGHIDKTGKVINPIQWEYCSSFFEGLACVQRNLKRGYIDRHMNMVIPIQWDSAFWFSEGFAPVRLGEKWGYIDRDGKIALPLEWDFAYIFREGRGKVERNGVEFMVQKQGNRLEIVKENGMNRPR